MDKVTCLVHIFPQSSPFLPHWHAFKVAMVTWRKVTCELNNMDFHSQSPTWLLTRQSVQSASKMLNPDMASFSRGTIQLPGSSILHWILPLWKTSCILNGTDTYLLWIYICLSYPQYFCPNHHPFTCKCLTCHNSILYSLASNQRIYPLANAA